MYIGEIIKKYRTEHELSQRAFANRTSLSPSYINTLEKIINPKTNKPYSITTEVANEFANAMYMNIDDLLKLLHEDQEFILNNSTTKTHLPVLGRIPAGIPLEMIEDIIDYEDISEEMIKGGKEYFALKITGDSMYPEYLNGDIIIVLRQNDCESGQDAIVSVNGDDATFKRVYKLNGGITLQPLNNQYMPVFYTNEDIINKPVKILGVVKQIRRDK